MTLSMFLWQNRGTILEYLKLLRLTIVNGKLPPNLVGSSEPEVIDLFVEREKALKDCADGIQSTPKNGAASSKWAALEEKKDAYRKATKERLDEHTLLLKCKDHMNVVSLEVLKKLGLDF